MSDASETRREIDVLIEAISNGTTSDEQYARLNVLLESDDLARREYVYALRQEAELHAIHKAVRDAALVREDDAAEGHPAAPQFRNRSIRFLPALLALAASIVLSAGLASWLTFEGLHGRGALGPALAERGATGDAAAPAIARLAATRNCRWGGERAHDLNFGAGISSGQTLELQTGLAELSFSNGARIVLEGPATFRVDSPQSVEVYRGRVAATVPVDAEGFSVKTPRLYVGDYGSSAQFGVVAADDGRDQVHVFEGELEAKSIDDRGGVASVARLSSLEGVGVSGADGALARFSADNDRFVRCIDSRNGPGDGLLAIEDFSYSVGPLEMQNGGFGWAGPWTVLEADETKDKNPERPSGVARGSLATSGLVALGNRFVQSHNYSRIRRVVSTNRGGVFDVAGCIEVIDAFPMVRRTGGAVYISFLQRVADDDHTFYAFELHRGDGRYNRVLCIANDVEGHGFGAAVDFQQPPGQPKFAPLGEQGRGVNFFVIRIDYGEKEQDKVTIYRNPESMVDESRCVADATLEGIFGFDRISIANFFGGKTHEIDEIRIGTDFRAVTGAIQREADGEPFSSYFPIPGRANRDGAALRNPAVAARNRLSPGRFM
jgi:hypothetical protein